MHTRLPSMLIVGNCIIDQIWTIDRFPDEDTEFRASTRTQKLGGNACNSASILARLGHEVELIAQLADDSDAEWIRRQLDQQAIQHSHCPSVNNRSTPVSSIWLNSSNGSRTICHHRDLPELSLQQLQQLDMEQYQWLHFEGRNIKALQEYLPAFIKNRTAPVSLEVEKPRQGIEALIPYVDVLIISSNYLKQTQKSATACLKEFSALNPCLKVVCTLGRYGLKALEGIDDFIEMTAAPVQQVVDSIGAGDCFIAGLISKLSQGESFFEALRFANKLAASKVEHLGMKFNIELLNV